MKLSKFAFLLVLITAISLIYVQLQIDIVKQAYAGSRNEARLDDILDDHSVLMYNILTLKSAQSVGDRLLSKEKNLQFAHRQQIAELKIPLQIANSANINIQGFKKQSNLLAKIFGFGSQAEAKQ